jgi:hypothetical protein
MAKFRRSESSRPENISHPAQRVEHDFVFIDLAA